MSTATTPRAEPRSHAPPATRPAGWLHSPGTDLLFVANVTWPLVPLLGLLGGFELHEGLRFWQVYFVTAPHRWITLLLVFGDRERLRERPRLLWGIAVITIAVCVGVRLSTGALTCLLAIDYAWNAWHFAAQHHGVYRIYERRSADTPGPGSRLVRFGLRGLVLYVATRVAIAVWRAPAFEQALQLVDLVVLAGLAALLLREFLLPSVGTAARLYLLSVGTLYGGMLLAIREDLPALVLLFATASALFHATEYLAVVSWSVRRRHGDENEARTLLAKLAGHWLLALVGFVVLLGSLAWTLDRRWVEVWLTINLIAAFLHYAYDGLIWRAPRRQPAS